MNPPSAQYDRMYEVSQEIWEIESGEEAEQTFIRGEAFNHLKWLEVERKALQDETERMTETVTVNGEFAGLERGDA